MKRIKTSHQDKTNLEIAQLCARAGLDKKAEDVVLLDVQGLSSFADYFVIMSGRSTRHVQGLADAVERELGSKRINAATCEGLSEGHWVLLDYDDVLVHIFFDETRAFYDLEGLWHDAPRSDIEATATEPRS